jgi:hypothetical protein
MKYYGNYSFFHNPPHKLLKYIFALVEVASVLGAVSLTPIRSLMLGYEALVSPFIFSA